MAVGGRRGSPRRLPPAAARGQTANGVEGRSGGVTTGWTRCASGLYLVPQLPGSFRGPQLGQRLALDLTDPLAREVEILADVVQVRG